MSPLWFGSDPDYDELCAPFASLVRWAGTRHQGEQQQQQQQQQKRRIFDGIAERSALEWQSTLDGWTAQLLLCDQFPRNIFRGTAEAFAYEDMARFWARRLASHVLSSSYSATSSSFETSSSTNPAVGVSGELPPPYVSSVVLALMHSEDLHDHEIAFDLLDRATLRTPPHLRDWWDANRFALEEHEGVVKRFGRYPHRNRAKSRKFTAAELEWLASDDVPGWARSQEQQQPLPPPPQ
jgi:uncharacterized protein (DUF924 family)